MKSTLRKYRKLKTITLFLGKFSNKNLIECTFVCCARLQFSCFLNGFQSIVKTRSIRAELC